MPNKNYAVCIVGLFFFIVTSLAGASQIGVGGSAFEEKLTREPRSGRARIAQLLGVLIKAPVHEEITQIAFACPAIDLLSRDLSCADANAGFANHFVIAGVRWNDLPPFKLEDGQGSTCKKALTGGPACTASQTIRFATQPECWYCLFNEASRIARDKEIAGCNATPSQAKGNLMTRSHYGDLQFFHAMASADGIAAEVTHKKVMDWAQFAWKVATREIPVNTFLRDINIDTIREHFGCSGWRVVDFYVQGRQDTYIKNVDEVALGSILHTIQDSFSRAHVAREPRILGRACASGAPMQLPNRIKEFHGYAKQDSHKHDVEDERESMLSIEIAGESRPAAIYASAVVVDLFRDDKSWVQVEPFFKCIFELADSTAKSSPGAYAN